MKACTQPFCLEIWLPIYNVKAPVSDTKLPTAPYFVQQDHDKPSSLANYKPYEVTNMTCKNGEPVLEFKFSSFGHILDSCQARKDQGCALALDLV